MGLGFEDMGMSISGGSNKDKGQRKGPSPPSYCMETLARVEQ